MLKYALNFDERERISLLIGTETIYFLSWKSFYFYDQAKHKFIYVMLFINMLTLISSK